MQFADFETRSGGTPLQVDGMNSGSEIGCFLGRRSHRCRRNTVPAGVIAGCRLLKPTLRTISGMSSEPVYQYRQFLRLRGKEFTYERQIVSRYVLGSGQLLSPDRADCVLRRLDARMCRRVSHRILGELVAAGCIYVNRVSNTRDHGRL